MGPPVEGIPGAGDGRELVADILPFFGTLSPRVRLTLRAALRLFEWLPFPWRFSRLDRGDAEAFLAHMESSRFFLHRDLLLLVKLLFNLARADDPAVREAVGASMSCATLPPPADSEPGPVPHPVGKTASPEEISDCEVLVIGSGAGGAAAACKLAEAGLDVMIVEAGGEHRHQHETGAIMPSLARLYRDSGLTVAAGRPALPIPVGRTLGGTTVINSGTCFRAPDSVLEDWRKRSGISWVGDLNRHFQAAEQFLQVKQLDAERMGSNGQLAMRGAAELGYSAAPIFRNAGNCYQCSGCPLGCPIDAKQSMRVSYLPRAARAGARLRTGVEVRRLLIENGHCVGAECTVREPGSEHLLSSGRTLKIRADRVILAGGALGTPEVLLRSGIGGSLVGREMRAHPATWVGARYPEPVKGWQGVMQSYYIDEWKSQGLLLEATFTPLAFGGAWLPGAGADFQRAIRDYGNVGSIGVHLTDRASVGRVRLDNHGVSLSYRLDRREAASLAFGIARAAEVHFAAGASEVYPNIAGLPRLRPGQLDLLDPERIRGPELRLEAFHPMGTARIDSDPRRGVCSPQGSVHGVKDLFVADASLFPSAVGVNPMMTVIALAEQIAEMMIEA